MEDEVKNTQDQEKEERGGEEQEILKMLVDSLNPPKEGEIVEGVVVKVTPTEVYVDIGSKSEGVAPRVEFKQPDINPGDLVQVYVESIDGRDGRTIVSKHKADFLIAWDRIKEAYQDNETVEAKVLRQVKGGLIVDVFGVDAFLPGSQLDVKKVKSIASFVGKEIQVKVIKLNRARKNIVVSRKEVVEEEQEKLREKLMGIKPGDVLEGVVRNLTDFGAFVDIGGVDGLVHISDLSWQKIKSPSDIVSPGEQIKVQVLEVDPQNLRLALSLKHLSPHPREKVKEKYPIGSKVKGVVKKLMDYGAFIELEPGIEGLVHISEMLWGRPPKHPSEVVKEGDRVEVVVLNVDIEKQRISLGMKQATPDPWSLVEEKYPIGSVVRGTVSSFGNFGAYIELEEGVEGFLHVGDISWTQRFSAPQEALRKSQKVRLKVLNIDKRNRFLELGLKQLRPNPWDEISRRIPPGTHLKAPIKEMTERGLVIEVDKGLEGFVPQSHVHKRGDPRQNYEVSEEVNLQVLRVEPERKRILLSEREYYQVKEKEEMARYRPEPARINLGEVLRMELERLEELKAEGAPEEEKEED